MSEQEPDESDEGHTDSPAPGRSPQLVPVRRRPNIINFVITGAVIGIIAAVVIANLPSDSGDEYSTLTAFGYFAVILGALGAMLGGLIGALFDRRAGN